MPSPKHSISAAAIVLNEKGEILLIKGPRRGWEMPGGQVEEGESLKDAAIRETKEECGLDIMITKFCGVFQNVEKSKCKTLFLGKQTYWWRINNHTRKLRIWIFPTRKSTTDGYVEKF